MSKKFHVRERTFLNLDPELRAYLIAIVEDTGHITTCCREHRYHGEIVLKMADCYEDISLHFDLSTKEQRENSLFKIKKMVEVLTAFRDALAIEAEAAAARDTVNLHERAMAAVH